VSVYSEVELATERAMAYLRQKLSDAELSRYEAAAEETPPKIYHLPPLNSIVLEREQVERFHIVVRPYEVKTQNEEV
jgi:hypothetical protein